jgi:hypothetical protein
MLLGCLRKNKRYHAKFVKIISVVHPYPHYHEPAPPKKSQVICYLLIMDKAIAPGNHYILQENLAWPCLPNVIIIFNIINNM